MIPKELLEFTLRMHSQQHTQDDIEIEAEFGSITKPFNSALKSSLFDEISEDKFKSWADAYALRIEKMTYECNRTMCREELDDNIAGYNLGRELRKSLLEALLEMEMKYEA